MYSKDIKYLDDRVSLLNLVARLYIALYTSPKGANRILNQNTRQQYSPNGTFLLLSLLGRNFPRFYDFKKFTRKDQTVDRDHNLILCTLQRFCRE